MEYEHNVPGKFIHVCCVWNIFFQIKCKTEIVAYRYCVPKYEHKMIIDANKMM